MRIRYEAFAFLLPERLLAQKIQRTIISATVISYICHVKSVA